MLRTSFAAIATLAVLASAMPASVTTAGELKGNQKKQRLLVPAVQFPRYAATRGQKTKPGALKGRSIGNKSKNVPKGTVKFFINGNPSP
jgi:hypothetical protein